MEFHNAVRLILFSIAIPICFCQHNDTQIVPHDFKGVPGYPDCYVLNPQVVSDGHCENFIPYNTIECGEDGGDCADFNKKFPGCDAPITDLVGDGICQYIYPYNTEKCNYDGGDCEEFRSLYPTCFVMETRWIGNGYCQDFPPYNTEACGYDGGDCPRSRRTSDNSARNILILHGAVATSMVIVAASTWAGKRARDGNSSSQHSPRSNDSLLLLGPGEYKSRKDMIQNIDVIDLSGERDFEKEEIDIEIPFETGEDKGAISMIDSWIVVSGEWSGDASDIDDIENGYPHSNSRAMDDEDDNNDGGQFLSTLSKRMYKYAQPLEVGDPKEEFASERENDEAPKDMNSIEKGVGYFTSTGIVENYGEQQKDMRASDDSLGEVNEGRLGGEGTSGDIRVLNLPPKDRELESKREASKESKTVHDNDAGDEESFIGAKTIDEDQFEDRQTNDNLPSHSPTQSQRGESQDDASENVETIEETDNDNESEQLGPLEQENVDENDEQVLHSEEEARLKSESDHGNDAKDEESFIGEDRQTNDNLPSHSPTQSQRGESQDDASENVETIEETDDDNESEKLGPLEHENVDESQDDASGNVETIDETDYESQQLRQEAYEALVRTYRGHFEEQDTIVNYRENLQHPQAAANIFVDVKQDESEQQEIADKNDDQDLQSNESKESETDVRLESESVHGNDARGEEQSSMGSNPNEVTNIFEGNRDTSKPGEQHLDHINPQELQRDTNLDGNMTFFIDSKVPSASKLSIMDSDREQHAIETNQASLPSNPLNIGLPPGLTEDSDMYDQMINSWVEMNAALKEIEVSDIDTLGESYNQDAHSQHDEWSDSLIESLDDEDENDQNDFLEGNDNGDSQTRNAPESPAYRFLSSLIARNKERLLEKQNSGVEKDCANESTASGGDESYSEDLDTKLPAREMTDDADRMEENEGSDTAKPVETEDDNEKEVVYPEQKLPSREYGAIGRSQQSLGSLDTSLFSIEEVPSIEELTSGEDALSESRVETADTQLPTLEEISRESGEDLNLINIVRSGEDKTLRHEEETRGPGAKNKVEDEGRESDDEYKIQSDSYEDGRSEEHSDGSENESLDELDFQPTTGGPKTATSTVREVLISDPSVVESPSQKLLSTLIDRNRERLRTFKSTRSLSIPRIGRKKPGETSISNKGETSSRTGQEIEALNSTLSISNESSPRSRDTSHSEENKDIQNEPSKPKEDEIPSDRDSSSTASSKDDEKSESRTLDSRRSMEGTIEDALGQRYLEVMDYARADTLDSDAIEIPERKSDVKLSFDSEPDSRGLMSRMIDRNKERLRKMRSKIASIEQQNIQKGGALEAHEKLAVDWIEGDEDITEEISAQHQQGGVSHPGDEGVDSLILSEENARIAGDDQEEDRKVGSTSETSEAKSDNSRNIDKGRMPNILGNEVGQRSDNEGSLESFTEFASLEDSDSESLVSDLDAHSNDGSARQATASAAVSVSEEETFASDSTRATSNMTFTEVNESPSYKLLSNLIDRNKKRLQMLQESRRSFHASLEEQSAFREQTVSQISSPGTTETADKDEKPEAPPSDSSSDFDDFEY